MRTLTYVQSILSADNLASCMRALIQTGLLQGILGTVKREQRQVEKRDTLDLLRGLGKEFC